LIRKAIEELDVFHGVVLAVSRPQVGADGDRTGGDQRIGDFDAVAAAVSLHMDTRLAADVSVDGYTGQSAERTGEGVELARECARP